MRHANPPGLAREIGPLSLASFVAMLAVGTLSPFLAEIADSLDTRLSVLGLVSTAALAATAAGGLVVGPLGDHLGHRTMLLWGLLLTGLAAAGTALVPGVLALALARAVGGVGFAGASGMPTAIAASRYDGRRRQRALAILATAGTVAGLAGAPLMTAIGAASTWRVAFLVVAATAGIAAAAVSLAVPRPTAAPAQRLDRRAIAARYAPILADRNVRLLYGATATQMFCLIGALTYAGAFLDDERGFALRAIGWAYMAQSAGGIIGGMLAGGRLGGMGLTRFYVLSMLAMGSLFLTFFAAPLGAWCVLPLALTGVAQVAGWVVLSTMLAERSGGGQGTTMALNGSVLGIGGALGAAAGGVTIDRAGYAAFGTLVLLFAMASALLGWRGYRRAGVPGVYNDNRVAVLGENRGTDDGRDIAPSDDG